MNILQLIRELHGAGSGLRERLAAGAYETSSQLNEALALLDEVGTNLVRLARLDGLEPVPAGLAASVGRLNALAAQGAALPDLLRTLQRTLEGVNQFEARLGSGDSTTDYG
jgi:hypothetical protein